ncbi:MAG: 2Fe-2S iron-sulfur cluster-binding protein, partial [Pseudomonadota bacterium]|nr:2Fe-2S iron-sulfur cluster-binding protein [Pseudomonadota bacterium]
MNDQITKSKKVTFTLDDEQVTADIGQTIWQAAAELGTNIPHLCYKDGSGYRADGNCRACMVEIAGERVLAASCQRKVSEGMVVSTSSKRAHTARKMVMELLVADQPTRATAPDPKSQLWAYAETQNVTDSRFARTTATPYPDGSHPAIAVNMEACIQCNLCVRACREVQVNDVIGLAGRGANAHIIFDFND